MFRNSVVRLPRLERGARTCRARSPFGGCVRPGRRSFRPPSPGGRGMREGIGERGEGGASSFEFHLVLGGSDHQRTRVPRLRRPPACSTPGQLFFRGRWRTAIAGPAAPAGSPGTRPGRSWCAAITMLSMPERRVWERSGFRRPVLIAQRNARCRQGGRLEITGAQLRDDNVDPGVKDVLRNTKRKSAMAETRLGTGTGSSSKMRYASPKFSQSSSSGANGSSHCSSV